MSLSAKTVSLTDTAVEIYNAGERRLYNGERRLVSLHNADGAEPIYLGGADVTASNAGIVMAAGDRVTLELEEGAGSLYAISTATGADLNVLTDAAVVKFA